MVAVKANALTAAKVGDVEALKKMSVSMALTDQNGASCLHYAARSGSLPVIEYLIKSLKFSEFQRTKTGATAMHDAAARGNTAVVKWFHDNTGLSVDDQDGIGVTSLHLAARYCHFLTVEWLLDEADGDSSVRTASDALPLHFAVAGGDLNCVKILVDEKPRMINMQMNNGATPIYLACQNGRLDLLQYLVSRNGATKIQAYDAMSCLHAAAQMGHLDVIKWLVTEEKMNPNDRDFDGATPLHYAASHGHADVVKWLLQEGGARVTLDNLGGSPLHTAAEFGESETVQALLDSGCDITLTDNEGLRADELAVSCQQDEVASLIRGDSNQEPLPQPGGHSNSSGGKTQQSEAEEALPPTRTPQLPLHSPRLSFPPPPSHPPEGEAQPSPPSSSSSRSLTTTTTTAVNTSFLDFEEAGSPSPPLPPPPPAYSPPESTPPSLGSPITPPSPIHLDGPSQKVEELPPGFSRVQTGQSYYSQSRRSVDSNASNFGIIEPRSTGVVHVVTAEVHSPEHHGSKAKSDQPSKADRVTKLPPPVPAKSPGASQIYHRLNKIAASQNQQQQHSSPPYEGSELAPTRGTQNLKRPTSFTSGRVDSQHAVLELESSSVLSTSADSIYSFKSTATVTDSIPPVSPPPEKEAIPEYVPSALSQARKNRRDRAAEGKVTERPQSVAQFKALFEKQIEAPDLRQERQFSMSGKSTTNSNGTAVATETKHSPRTSTNLAVTQPLKEGRHPGKTVVTVNGNHVPETVNNGKTHSLANGGLASHAAAIAAVARHSQQYDDTPDETPASNGQPTGSISSQTSSSSHVPTSSLVNNSNGVSKVESATSSQGSNSRSSTSPVTSPRASSHNLMADIQSAVSGTSNLTLRKAKSRGEGVSMVFQSSKSLKRNSGTSATVTSSSSNTSDRNSVDSSALTGDFDPKNFLDQVEKVDSTGRAIPEWRRQVLAKHAAEKAQKDFEEKREIENYEARFANMPAWKRAIIERKEQQARDEQMQGKK